MFDANVLIDFLNADDELLTAVVRAIALVVSFRTSILLSFGTTRSEDSATSGLPGCRRRLRDAGSAPPVPVAMEQVAIGASWWVPARRQCRSWGAGYLGEAERSARRSGTGANTYLLPAWRRSSSLRRSRSSRSVRADCRTTRWLVAWDWNVYSASG